MKATVNNYITLRDGKTVNVPSTIDGSKELLQALQSAKLSAGR